MKKGLIVAALMGLVVFAGCYHVGEETATKGGTTSTPAAETTK